MNGIPNNPKEFLERVNKISPEFEITGNYTKLSETYLHCKCKNVDMKEIILQKLYWKPNIVDIVRG